MKFKLVALCFFMSVISLLVGAVGFWGVSVTSKYYSIVTDISLPNVQSLARMATDYRGMRLRLLTITLPGLSRADLDDNIEKAFLLKKSFEANNEKYRSLPSQEGEEVLYQELYQVWVDFNERVFSKSVELYRQGTLEARNQVIALLLKEGVEIGKRFQVASDKLFNYHEERARINKNKAISMANQATTVSIAVILFGALFGMTVGYRFASRLAFVILEVARDLSQGAIHVGQASQNVASTSEELSASSAEQSAAVQQIAASVEEVSAMVTKNADHAKRSQEASNSSSSATERGKQVVERLVQSMQEIGTCNQEITQQIEKSNQEISEIVKVIEAIGHKTKVINDIVFQTKLLSFNASVEAARAGDRGKGFAVVAEEVGNLAQMSGHAAKEISGMLEESIKKVEEIVDHTRSRVEVLIQSAKQRVEAGSSTALECAEVLQEVVVKVNEVKEMSVEISSASSEQSRGIQEIASAMRQIEQVTQQNTTATQESAASAQELASQVESVKKMVQTLSQVVEGVKAESKFQIDSNPAQKASQIEKTQSFVA
jgi:methyl-accepting chemotaxis protein